MRRAATVLAILLVAAGLSGCVGTGSQWIAQNPARLCTINAQSGLGMDSPTNNSTGLSSTGVLLTITITYVNSAPILWAINIPVTLNGSNGTAIDVQLKNTTPSPIKPYWSGVLPPLAPGTFYTVSDKGQPSQVIGCFTTR